MANHENWQGISLNPENRDAFRAAMLLLQAAHADRFAPKSHLVVEAVVKCGQEALKNPDAVRRADLTPEQTSALESFGREALAIHG